MQKLGLNNNHIVIIYDNSPLLSSARCWFLLRYFGHKEIFIYLVALNHGKKMVLKQLIEYQKYLLETLKQQKKIKN